MQWIKKNNIILRLSALFIAILLWFYVVSELNPDMDTKIRNIDIQITDVEHLTANGLVIVSGGNETADIKLRGKRDRLNLLKADNIKLSASASAINVPGTYNLSYNIGIDVADVSVVSKSPAQITVVVDRIATRTIPVSVTFTGNEREGYRVDSHTITPNAIVVKGPKTQLDKIDKVVASCVIDDAHKPFEKIISYRFIDAKGYEVDMDDITVDAPSIKLSADVKRAKSVPFVVDFISDEFFSEDIVNAKFSVSSVMIYGDVESVDKINSIKLGSLSIRNLILSGKTSVSYNVVIPDGVSILDEIKKVDVTIETPNYDYRKITVNSDWFAPLRGYAFEQGAQIEVEVFGPSNVVSKLTEKDFSVVAGYIENSADENKLYAVLKVSTSYSEVVVLGSYTADISKLAE